METRAAALLHRHVCLFFVPVADGSGVMSYTEEACEPVLRSIILRQFSLHGLSRFLLLVFPRHLPGLLLQSGLCGGGQRGGGRLIAEPRFQRGRLLAVR